MYLSDLLTTSTPVHAVVPAAIPLLSPDISADRSTVAIIQARMGSTRLPRKVMYDIAGKPMLWHVVKRAQRAKTLGQVIVATTTLSEDDAIESLCLGMGVPCYRGNATDVLDRYYQAACLVRASTIVRLTADCPLHDPQIVDRVVQAYGTHAEPLTIDPDPSSSTAKGLRSGYDYVSNVDPPTFPDGLDTEVFSFDALERAWNRATLPSEREHVTPYLRNPENGFKTTNITHTMDLSHLRWTVDELADLAFVRAIYHALPTLNFGMEAVLALLAQAPQLGTLNAHHFRNEGYCRSLAKDSLAA